MRQISFPALTGMRALAAYMVFIHHINFFSADFFGTGIHGFFDEFHIGVTIFFVLSGFLIAHRYYEDNNFDFRAYIIKRFARIYPMYFILTSFTFLLGLFYWRSEGSLYVYLLNITFFRGFFNELKFSGIAQGWSLTVEEMFYLVAPLCFVFIRRHKWMIVVFPFFFILIGLFLVSVFEDFYFYGLMDSNNFMFVYTFFGRCCEFFVGIGLAIYLKQNRPKPFKHITILSIISMFFLIYLLSVFRENNQSGLETVQGKVINTLFLPLFAIAPLFYGLVKEKTFLSKILSTKVALLLGKSSYVFYLIHIGVFKMILSKITPNPFFLFLILNLLAVVFYFFIEKPLHAMIRRAGNA